MKINLARVNEEKVARGVIEMLKEINNRLHKREWDRLSDIMICVVLAVPYNYNVVKFIQNRLTYGKIKCELHSFQKGQDMNTYTWKFKLI